MADIYGMAMQGLNLAREGKANRERKTLGSLLQQAYTQPEQRTSALGQAMAIDPQAGMAAHQQFSGMDDERRSKVARHAQIFDTLPEDQKAQLYPQLAAEVRSITGIPVPEQYDPKFLGAIRQVASWAGGGAKPAEGFTLGPGAARYGADGKMVASQPFAPASGQVVPVPDGKGGTQQMVFDPRTGQFTQPNYGQQAGGAQQAMEGAYQGAKLDPVNDFSQLASGFPGTQVSSLLRDPRHNAEVGGKPNSYHKTGEAGDFVVPAEQRAAFMAAARTRGYQAIDEGDHVHVEPPHRGMTASQFGAGQRLGYQPPKADTGTPSALMEKLQLAQTMGASQDQLRQMVMGDIGGGKPTATQMRQANAAKLKLVDLNAIEQQLQRVDDTFKPLENTFSATPYVGKFLPTEDGKRFDAAVSLLQGMVRKLTRTPGEGAMSDYETKLAQLANPSRSEYESVTADQLTQLRDLVATMRQGYQAVLEDNGGNSRNITPQKAQPDTSIDALLDKYK